MPIQQMFLGLGAKGESEETISSTTTDLVLATLFGSDWTADIPKILNINSGVTVGGTSGNAAILVSTGLVNTLVINNSGTITGHGGAAGNGVIGTSNSGSPGGDGGDGGTGISVVSAGDGVTINNTGTISGGGGGGGGGGAGERGRMYYAPLGSYINVSGKAGGAGGLGAGYNQSATSGATGQSGTANAGAGGNGGDGGALGAAGSNGTQGGYTSSASRTPGQGGDGGAAGAAIKNDGATWTNSGGGTYNGAYT